MKNSTLLFEPISEISLQEIVLCIQDEEIPEISGKATVRTELAGSETKAQVSVTVTVEKITLTSKASTWPVLFESKAKVGETDLSKVSKWSVVFEGKAKVGETDFKCTLSKEKDDWELEIQPLESEVNEKPAAITEPNQCKIQTKEIEIPTSGQLGNFPDEKTRIAAARLVEFLRTKLGGWSKFTIDGLFQFYQEMGWRNEGILHGLYGDLFGTPDPGDLFIVVVEKHPSDGNLSKLAVTTEFINKCVEPVTPTKK